MPQLKLFFISLLFAITPSLALAVERLDWKTHGITALVIAVVGAMIWVRLNKNIQTTAGRIMGFGLYFWILVFLQAMLYGLMYGISR